MSWYTNLKIRVKLLLGFIFVTCILIFVGVYAMFKLQDMADSSDYVFSNFTKPLGEMVAMTRNFYTLRIQFRDLYRSDINREYINNLIKDSKETIKDLEALNDEYETSIVQQQSREIFSDYKNMMKDWENKFVALAEQRASGLSHSELTAEFEEIRAMGDVVAVDKLGALLILR